MSKLPSLPPVHSTSPSLDNWIKAVTEHLEVLEGRRGDPTYQAVTKAVFDANTGQLRASVNQALNRSAEEFARTLQQTAAFKELKAKIGQYDALSASVRETIRQMVNEMSSKLGADIASKQIIQQDAINSLAIRLDSVQSGLSDSLASVRELSVASSDYLGSVASRVTTVEASVGASEIPAGDILDNGGSPYVNLAALQAAVPVGAWGKYYRVKDPAGPDTLPNLLYRWNGSAYEIGGSGTSATAQQKMDALADRAGNAEAQYSVKVNANGKVAGFGLSAVSPVAGGSTSAFVVQADKFAIISGTDTFQTTPFLVDGTGVYIDTAVIRSLSAGKITTGSIASGQTLSSTGTTGGVASWSINGNGSAVFRSISIQDAAGNVILSAGSSLKSQVTSVVSASDVGAISTTLSNAPSSILNGNISIGSNGALSGAGGGQVTIGGLGYTGDLNATYGASWGSTLSGRPTELTDGRISTALSSAGLVISGVKPGVAINSSVSGGGLYLGSDYMGYHNGSAWKTYMDNLGNFYLGGASGALQWNGTTLSITSGTISSSVTPPSGWVNSNVTFSGLSDKPTSLSGINSSEGTKLSGIAAGATVGATWGTNVYSRPTELTDGRISTALSAAGLVISGVKPGVAINSYVSGGGLYLGSDYMGYHNGSAWKTYMDSLGNFYLGGSSGALQWNGTTLSITSGSIGSSVTPPSGWVNSNISIGSNGALSGAGGGQVTIGGLGYTGDLNATYGASWGSTLSGRPTELTDGRISTAISAAGLVISGVKPGVVVSPGGVAGLYLGSDYLGYYNGSAWRTYMDNSGNFYLTGSGSNSLSWNGTTLTINGGGTFSGTLSAASGSFGNVTLGSTSTSGVLQSYNNTGYNQTGIFIGYSSTAYMMSLKSGSNSLLWDGTNLTITGAVSATALSGTVSGTVEAGGVASMIRIGSVSGILTALESSVATSSLSGSGFSTSKQLTSTIADGTAPFAITSKTMCSNLNVNYVNGIRIANATSAPTSGGVTHPSVSPTGSAITGAWLAVHNTSGSLLGYIPIYG